MPESTKKYERTSEEFKDQQLSWERDDKAFFASGACHILAYTFANKLVDSNYKIIFIKPSQQFGSIGTHVYVTDGEWAFDFNGWSKESDLLRVNEEAYQTAHEGWTYEKVEPDVDLETFCKDNNHRLPKDFAGDVVARAEEYIKVNTIR